MMGYSTWPDPAPVGAPLLTPERLGGPYPSGLDGEFNYFNSYGDAISRIAH